MNHRSVLNSVSLILGCLLMATVPVSAADQGGMQILRKADAAAGGRTNFEQLGILEMVREQAAEKKIGLAASKERILASTFRLDNIRIETADDRIIVKSGDNGWSIRGGVPDDRPHAGQIARLTANEMVFVALLPFSATLDDIEVSQAHEVMWGETRAYGLLLTFDDNVFASEVMNFPWMLYVAQDDLRILGAEYLPRGEVAKLVKNGLRYHVESSQMVDGIRLPQQIRGELIDLDGRSLGIERMVTVTTKVHGPWDGALFANPAAEEDDE